MKKNNNININDNIKNFSQIFDNSSSNEQIDKNNSNIFVSTEMWIAQLGRRIIS